VWRCDKKEDYIKRLSSADFMSKLHSFNEHVNTSVSANEINLCIDEFSNIISEVASSFFKREVKCESGSVLDVNSNFCCKWYTEECYKK
jgi:hypothetical protein